MRRWRTWIVTAFALFGGCASAPNAPPSEVAASPAFTASQIPQNSNNGLMIIGVRAFDMDSHDRIGNAQQVLTGLSVKNQATGQSFNIYLTSDFAVTQLPTGTYCISDFRTYSNVDLPYCKPPFFSISAGDAANLGYVLIGVNYRGSGGSTRYKPFYFYKSKLQLAENLTPAARDAVARFLGEPSPTLNTLVGSTWYGYDYSGMYYEWRFKPQGVVESQAEALGSYGPVISGKWTLDGTELTVTFNDLSLLCKGTLKDGVLSGMAEITNRPASEEYYTGDHWIWQLTTNPAAPAPYANSKQARPAYRGGIHYPASAFAAGTTGSVTVHYRLPKPQDLGFGVEPTVLPKDVKVESSTPKGVFDLYGAWAVKNSYYGNLLVDGKPVESEGEETIAFKIVDGKPVIEYSMPLVPLSGPLPPLTER